MVSIAAKRNRTNTKNGRTKYLWHLFIGIRKHLLTLTESKVTFSLPRLRKVYSQLLFTWATSLLVILVSDDPFFRRSLLVDNTNQLRGTTRKKVSYYLLRWAFRPLFFSEHRPFLFARSWWWLPELTTPLLAWLTLISAGYFTSGLSRFFGLLFLLVFAIHPNFTCPLHCLFTRDTTFFRQFLSFKAKLLLKFALNVISLSVFNSQFPHGYSWPQRLLVVPSLLAFCGGLFLVEPLYLPRVVSGRLGDLPPFEVCSHHIYDGYRQYPCRMVRVVSWHWRAKQKFYLILEPTVL